MKFSIITICLNDLERLRGTIESVRYQKYRNFEHIIIDGGSTDGTLQYLRKLQEEENYQEMVIYSEPDNGIYDAMNKGIEKSDGEYLCFMNGGDQLYSDDSLNDINQIIDDNSGYDIYYGTAVVIYATNQTRLQVSFPEINDNEEFLERMKSGQSLMPMHQAIFASRGCFDDNKFNLEYRLRAELDWYFNCMRRKKSSFRLNIVICKYLVGGTSSSVVNNNIDYIELQRLFTFYEIPKMVSEQYFEKRNRSANWSVLLGEWLALYQAGKSTYNYFFKQDIHHIAIYGYGVLGNHLLADLKNQKIDVEYFIDQGDVVEIDKIPVKKMNENLPKVDMIVITVIQAFDEIKRSLQEKVDYRIVSLEEVIEKAWYL